MTSLISTQTQISRSDFVRLWGNDLSGRPTFQLGFPPGSPGYDAKIDSFVREINGLRTLEDFRKGMLAGRYDGAFVFSGAYSLGNARTDDTTLGRLTAFISPQETSISFLRVLANESWHLDNTKLYAGLRVEILRELNRLTSGAGDTSAAALAGFNKYASTVFRTYFENEVLSEIREVGVSVERFSKLQTALEKQDYLNSIGGGFRLSLFLTALRLQNDPSLSQQEYSLQIFKSAHDLMAANESSSYYFKAKTDTENFFRPYLNESQLPKLSPTELERLNSSNRSLDGSLIGSRIDGDGNLVTLEPSLSGGWVERTITSNGDVLNTTEVSAGLDGVFRGITVDKNGIELARSTFTVFDDGSRIEQIVFANGSTGSRTFDSTNVQYALTTERFINGQKVVTTENVNGVINVEIFEGSQLVRTENTTRFGSGNLEQQTADGNGTAILFSKVVTLPDGSKIQTTAGTNGVVTETALNGAGLVTGSVTWSNSGTSTTGIFKDGTGNLLKTELTQRFDDGPALRLTDFPDGASVRQTGDFSDPQNPIIYTSQGTAPPMQQFGSALQDVNSIIQQIRGGASTGLIANSGLRLLNNQVNPVVNGTPTVNNVPLFTTASIANGFASIYSIDRAFSTGGNYEAKLSTTLNGIVAINAAANAVQGAISGTVNAVASQTLNSVASSISSALPFVNIALAIKSGDPVGIGVAVASAMGVPVIGWIYAAYQIISAITYTPPEAWGIAKVTFSSLGDTSIKVDVAGAGMGTGQVKFLFEGNGKPATDPQYFGGLLGYLNETMVRQQQANPNVPLGIIPQRVPTISWRESLLSDPGYSITDINPLTGEQVFPHLRYNDNFTPYNADATVEAQRRNIFERMVDSSLARQAIAPMWEVQTARMQQDQGDPNAGLTEEQRASKRGELAAADAQGKRLPGVFRPVVLDLNGDNTITTISNANSNVNFDWDDTRFRADTGWVGAGEGLLVLDRNANGKVDSGRELFSNGEVNNAARGVRSMSWVDGNADGALDASDPVFNALRVWQDANSNGVQDTGETKTLSELGITKLDYSQSRFTRNGQEFSMQSPDIEASNEGIQAYQITGGIQINHSNGSSTLLVSSELVTDTGGGTGQGTTFTVGDEAIASYEDGLSPDDPRSKDSTQRQSISILISNLLANDKFNNSSAGLTITSVDSAQNGSVYIDAAQGFVVFTPDQNYNGVAGFNYTVAAPDGQTRVGRATLNLAAVNDAPTVTFNLDQRAVYGWDVLTTGYPSYVDAGGDTQPGTQVSIIEGGTPFYEPFYTISVRAPIYSTAFTNDGDPYRFISGYYDTGIDSFVPRPDGYSLPNTSFFLKDQVREIETANTGRLSVNDVDGNPSVRYVIESNGLYGTASINENSGVFSYTGRRYVEPVESPYFAYTTGTNVNTNLHSRAEAQTAFNDLFQVRIVDLSDPSGQTFKIQNITVPHYGPAPAPDVAYGGKPIAIDLDGDGFEFINVDDSNVFIDVKGDGIRRRSSWVGADDGILAYDENANGKIDGFSEISFTRFLAGAQTDLQGLRAFDTNNDGLFSAADAKWNSFGIWQDANSNGVNETGEFRSLTDLGIQSIGLASDGTFRVINGQTVHGVGNVTRTNGTTLALADVTLAYNNTVQATTPNGAPTTATISAFSQGQQFTGTTSPDLVFGTSGNDEFTLGDGNDVVVDDLGNDRVTSGAGDDLIYTGADDDFIDAGDGNDNLFAGNGNDFAYGGIGDDVMFLEGGNDIAFGGDGNDTIAGGIGNDLLSGDAGNDKLLGESGRDQLFGQSGDDELWGMDGDDALFGGVGNDLLVGGDGADQMEGGEGNDSYEVDNVLDVIVELAGEGVDTVDASIDYTLATELENLTLTGTQAFQGTGNEKRNVLVGSTAANTLIGLGGNDLLDGGQGADTLIGGTDDDTYIVDNANDLVTELAGEGVDTIQSRINYTLGANVENLTLIGIAAINGTGNSADNVLAGNDAANTLDGGLGADTMRGGKGNDTYVVESAGDQIVENADEGYDTIIVNGLLSYVLGANIEALTLGAGTVNGTGNALNNTLRGNAANNQLDGGAGADVMFGGAGDDIYVVDNAFDIVVENAPDGNDTVRSSVTYALSSNVEKLELTGSANIDANGNDLNNIVIGNAGNNRLDGGFGADVMTGGLGNDTYIVDNVGDLVTESLNEGTDRVRSSITYALNANVEELELAGTANVNATGNALSNAIIGNSGNNVLDGGIGADSMSGGAGDDTYVVDNVGDVVTELTASGTDTVNVMGLASYTLADNVEALLLGAGSLDGSGNALNNTLTGNASANTLDGKAGVDTMAGGSGNDIYIVDNAGDVIVENVNEGTDRVKSSVTYSLAANVEELELTGAANINAIGNSLSNTLIGNSGNNVLDGGVGADSMSGGAGDDTYTVDNIGDVVTELAASGTDTVNVVGLAAYTLTDNVEALVLGAGSLEGSGNALNNTLTGNSSANTLDGNAGADTMVGDAGNDIYIVDNTSDVVVENLNEGTDRIKSSITYTLAANVEELVLTGTANINATGNTLSNVLIGNSMSNTLDGGAGADMMAGGAGDDTYIVDNVGDVVTELLLEGFDKVSSSIDYVLPQNVEQVTLTGTAIRATGNQLDNLLFGNAQANILDGGTGADQLAGGFGDDRYVVDNVADVINEALDSGNDTVVSTVTYMLASNVENILLTGTTAINGAGNTLANVLVGNTGANTLDAGAGNDVLAGGKGNDSLIGGAGDDLFLYNQGEGYDIISDASGTDTLRFGTGITLDSISARTVTTAGVSKLVVSILGTDGQETSDGLEWLLGAGGVSPIERFEFVNALGIVSQAATLAQIAVAARTLNGGNGNDTLTGDRSDDTINASNGNDIAYGRSGNDTLYGDSGADKLFGEGGNDRLYGGSDSDELWGGSGNDLLDGGDGNDLLVGGTGDDSLYGGNNIDKLDGGDGNDLLDGSNGEDELYAGAGNDIIDGGNDADLVAAGAGNDTITTGNGLDVVIAGAGDDYVSTDNDADFVDAGSGIDTILTGFGADFIAAGTGNDIIDAGGDQDIIAFNKGDGADTVLTSSWQRDTLSLGGGIKYADLSLSKVGNNLVLNLGGTDSMTFKDWYLDTTRRNVTTLQVVTAATGGDFSAGSTDRMKNKGAVNFNFEALVNKFDQVRAASPTLTSWPLATQLDAFYSSGSNTQALGGNLAYRYATTGSYGDLGWAGVRAAMQGLNGTTQQGITASTTVNPWVALQAGISLIADQTVGLPSPITITAAPTSDELFFAAVGASGRTTSWRGATASPVLP
jgi:Ca2+-binding RTX toxin-like protein